MHAMKIQTGGLIGGGFGTANAWLAQLRCGALSPDSAFAVVQELPNRQRPRAMQALLHDLSGDQILALLTEATRYRLEGWKYSVFSECRTRRRWGARELASCRGAGRTMFARIQRRVRGRVAAPPNKAAGARWAGLRPGLSHQRVASRG